MESFPALKAKIKTLELAAIGTHLGESFSCSSHRSILFLSFQNSFFYFGERWREAKEENQKP